MVEVGELGAFRWQRFQWAGGRARAAGPTFQIHAGEGKNKNKKHAHAYTRSRRWETEKGAIEG